MSFESLQVSFRLSSLLQSKHAQRHCMLAPNAVLCCAVQKYAAKYGGTPLGPAELQSMFKDFQPGGADNNMISQDDFLVSGHCTLSRRMCI